jgi:hypothetical protein
LPCRLVVVEHQMHVLHLTNRRFDSNEPQLIDKSSFVQQTPQQKDDDFLCLTDEINNFIVGQSDNGLFVSQWKGRTEESTVTDK